MADDSTTIARVVAGLRALLEATEAVAATRSSDTLFSMLNDGANMPLMQLAEAQGRARALLAETGEGR